MFLIITKMAQTTDCREVFGVQQNLQFEKIKEIQKVGHQMIHILLAKRAGGNKVLPKVDLKIRALKSFLQLDSKEDLFEGNNIQIFLGSIPSKLPAKRNGSIVLPHLGQHTFESISFAGSRLADFFY